MNKVTMSSSSDEDDLYTNSVARLRALKKQRIEGEIAKSIKQQTNSKEINSEDINDKKINGEDLNDKKINGEDLNGKKINGENLSGNNIRANIYSEEISSDTYNEEMSDNVYNEEMFYDVIQTRSRTVRSRRNKQITTRSISRRTRGRRLPTDLEYDVEFMSQEKPESTLQSCKDNIIALSDDDADNEDDNYEMNIKVHWRSSRIDRLSMRRHDSFKKIFQYYADLEKVSVSEVLIMKKEKIINHTDTPASLKLSIIDILDGGIVNPGMNSSKDETNDENICTIKIQTANKKQSLTIPLKKDEQFKTLFANCAKQLDVKEKKLKFYFDGEQISPTDTPESLDLEGEACIDLHIST